MIKLYTKDNCRQCIMVKKFLKENNINYTELPIMDHLDYIKNDLGYNSAPVVEINDDNFYGFNIVKLRELLK